MADDYITEQMIEDGYFDEAPVYQEESCKDCDYPLDVQQVYGEDGQYIETVSLCRNCGTAESVKQ